MGRKRTIGLEWLDPQDINQRYWAIEFLFAKGYQKLFDYQRKIRSDKPPSHEQMLHAGIEIERNAGARELLKDMKDAWRQQRNRNKKKQQGHLVCTFTLNGETKKNLKKMASELSISATELVENLIAKAYQTHIRKQAKQPRGRLAKTPKGSRSDKLIGKENHKKKHPQASTSPEVPEDKSSSTYDTKATDALSISNDDLARSQEKPRKPIESILKNMSKSNKKTYRVPIGMQKKIAAVEDMDESGPLEVSPNLDE
ncbi:hypothetical protein [Stutzerimonas nitrititolerans]|uniref:hypothetical protein n=1 Tax=Stutzerimonas nitrititolerans TaxID=2482751 RepID=UPI0028A1B7EF|nr:hypothetical protein [Stutzerimonas nitrititolerans]